MSRDIFPLRKIKRQEKKPQIKTGKKKKSPGNTPCILLTVIYYAPTMCQPPWEGPMYTTSRLHSD